MASYSIEPSPCPFCGILRTAIGDAPASQPERAPLPGDIVICPHCAAIGTVDEHGRPAAFTQEQLDAITHDEAIMRQLAREIALMGAARQRRHAAN